MKCEFSGTVSKILTEPDSNEDSIVFSERKNKVCVCDGAGESFDSRLWARILAHKFVNSGRVGPEWIQRAISEYLKNHDFHSMSWAKQASFERGSYSTLVGAQYFPQRKEIQITAIGDSVALLFDEEKLVGGWPFCDPSGFKSRPTLLATLHQKNNFLTARDFRTRHKKTYSLREYATPRLLCMTDAIGEWALNESMTQSDGISQLLSLKSSNELRALVERERSARRMRIDDSTVIMVSFDDKQNDEISDI